MSELMPVDAARSAVLAGLEPLEIETVLAPEAALGRVVATKLAAAVSLPPWDNSAMDGYAVRSGDLAGASDRTPVRLLVTGEVRAGERLGARLEAGTAVRIATGAPVPPGADAVVPVESTTPLSADGVEGPRGREAAGPLPAACLVHEAVGSGNAIRRAGSDIVEGVRVASAGDVVTPAVVALLAGAGVTGVPVRRRPVVGVLATGDEIRRSGDPLGLAGIPDANGPALRSLVREAGGEPLDLGIATDTLGDVQTRLEAGIRAADLVVVAGGVSVGPYDVVRSAFDAVGRVDLWRVALQPGKPFAFGHAERPDEAALVLLFGLPGNPVSVFVTFELFVRPVIRRLAGHVRLERPADRGVLEESVTKSHGRRGYQRVCALRAGDGSPVRDGAGRVRVKLAGGQGSHMLSSLALADALAVIPEDVVTAEAGTSVELRWLDRA